MYEGRTRGKKLKYTYSEDEDVFSDDQPSTRRSTRNATSTEAPTETRRPQFTASGRQIRSRTGGLYGEALLSGQRDGAGDEEFYDDEEEEVSRPQRTRTSIHPNGYSGYHADDLDDASEVHSSANDSGNEWRGAEDDLEHDFEGDDEEEEEEEEEQETSADGSIGNEEPESLVVQLRYGKGDGPSNPEVQIEKPPPAEDVEMEHAGEAASSAQEPQTTVPHSSDSGAQQVPTQPAPATTAPSAPSAPVTHEANQQKLVETVPTLTSQAALDGNPDAPKASEQPNSNGVNQA